MHTDLTLVVLAAGMGSRYGGLKQVDGFGPSQETILEYSVWDAIKAGFTHVVFVIREEFAERFQEHIWKKVQQHITVSYAYQDLTSLVPPGFTVDHRLKPWGTAHAVLVAKDFISTPFGVINADDYYGVDGYHQLAHFLKHIDTPLHMAMVGYVLKNTLSQYGAVNRWVCTVENNSLVSIEECLQIERENDLYSRDATGRQISNESIVSMNFWWFHHDIISHFEQQFTQFLNSQGQDPKKEWYIPSVVDTLIHTQQATCTVLTSQDHRCGVTYPEDKPQVLTMLSELVQQWVYPTPLW